MLRRLVICPFPLERRNEVVDLVPHLANEFRLSLRHPLVLALLLRDGFERGASRSPAIDVLAQRIPLVGQVGHGVPRLLDLARQPFDLEPPSDAPFLQLPFELAQPHPHRPRLLARLLLQLGELERVHRRLLSVLLV